MTPKQFYQHPNHTNIKVNSRRSMENNEVNGTQASDLPQEIFSIRTQHQVDCYAANGAASATYFPNQQLGCRRCYHSPNWNPQLKEIVEDQEPPGERTGKSVKK